MSYILYWGLEVDQKQPEYCRSRVVCTVVQPRTSSGDEAAPNFGKKAVGPTIIIKHTAVDRPLGRFIFLYS